MESFASSGIKVLYSIYSTQYNLLYIHEPIIFPGVHCTVYSTVFSAFLPPAYYVRYNIWLLGFEPMTLGLQHFLLVLTIQIWSIKIGEKFIYV